MYMKIYVSHLHAMDSISRPFTAAQEHMINVYAILTGASAIQFPTVCVWVQGPDTKITIDMRVCWVVVVGILGCDYSGSEYRPPV